MMLERALRFAAVAIAIAGLADPTWTRERPVRQPLTLVSIDAPPGAAAGLAAQLVDDYDVAHITDRGSDSAACPSSGGCVLVSSGRVPHRITAGAAVIGALRVGSDAARRVRITAVEASPLAHLSASAALRVHLQSNGARTTRIRVIDEGAVVGTEVHEWPAAGQDRHEATVVVVPWAPLAPGVRRLRIEARESTAGTVAPLAEGRAGEPDDSADIGVEVETDPIPLLFYEPEATWLGTFVRRALEDDRRFAVAGQTRLAPRIAVGRGMAGALTAGALERVWTAIVAAPDALTAADVDLLERFVRVRGGSVVVLADRRPSGTITRLLPRSGREFRAPKPVDIDALRATEILTFDVAGAGTTTLASASRDPVIVSRALGRGRVIISGALDAWRYRDAAGGFSGFWTSLVADAAVAAGPGLDGQVAATALNRGERTSVTIETRSMTEAPADITVGAVLDCASGRQPLRLWPGTRPGMYTGTVVADGAGACVVEATVGQRQLTVPMLITNDMRAPVSTRALDAAIAAHGGIVANAGEEATLAARVRERLQPAHERQPTHPLRSPWWMVPFGACLGGEWLLRRRRGLR
jgi:hypothetical protein